MQIITVGALKGGVGKTNFTFNLGAFLSIEKEKRVLLIDLDPQGNLTQCCQLNPEKPFSMFLFQKNTLLKNIIFETHINNLSIIPVNIEAIKLEIQLNNEISREKILLSYFRENYEYFKNNYDYILIDTNPSLNITNTNAYAVVNSIVLLCDNSIHSLRAIDMVFDVWSNLCQKMEIKNNIKAIVLNNFDHYKISKDFKKHLEYSNFKNFVLKQEIRKKQKFKNSEITGKPAIKLISKLENPYFNIVNELKEKGVL